ncbi:chromate transporter [Jeongeupia naejangsanensis]|uniref:Chromate transporter n=1 Tax=Jeongeupia naejangsanensis TaxID=613195 RepID=A0ABS2BQE6_9NEIS|nr:chromate transporter [Jeongeupia naejangsanensis]MBM3117171.1 chromate transporter [Jeongeupia naejangsanensis]
MTLLLSLFGHFAQLSLIAFGGASAVLPDMHRVLVTEHHWLSESAFAASYTIAQVAPGPNLLFVLLFGLQIAGLPGALVALLAMCLPSSLIALAVEHYGHRHREHRWHQLIRRALAPLTIALILATGVLLINGSRPGIVSLTLTAATVVIGLKTRFNPIWLIAAGALLGAFGWR